MPKTSVLRTAPCSVTGAVLTVEETRTGLRSLNLSGQCQSDIQVLGGTILSKKQPLELVQIMSVISLGWLDLIATPAGRALLIGLGGGSIARVLADNMAPGHSIHSVELEPEVLQAAVDFFALALTPGRCTAEAGDGSGFIREHRRKCEAGTRSAPKFDVLILDAFTSDGLCASTQQCRTIDDARACLTERGLLLVNLHTGDTDDPDYATARRMLRALCARFEAVYSVLCESTQNLIALCHMGESMSEEAWRAVLGKTLKQPGVAAACGALSLDGTLSRLKFVGGREQPMSDDEIECGVLPD